MQETEWLGFMGKPGDLGSPLKAYVSDTVGLEKHHGWGQHFISQGRSKVLLHWLEEINFLCWTPIDWHLKILLDKNLRKPCTSS